MQAHSMPLLRISFVDDTCGHSTDHEAAGSCARFIVPMDVDDLLPIIAPSLPIGHLSKISALGLCGSYSTCDLQRQCCEDVVEICFIPRLMASFFFALSLSSLERGGKGHANPVIVG